MGKIILVGATKGGVGKSVTSYNLAYSLASLGKKVLAVDFDSQANHTTCYRIEKTEPRHSERRYKVLSGMIFGR